MGFLAAANTWVDSLHEPPPSWWRREGRPSTAQNYASRVYPQNEDPTATQSWVAAAVTPPRSLPRPLPADVTATRVNPVLEDVQQLMAWAGQTGVAPPTAARTRPAGQDLLPVNVPAVAGVVPGWDSAAAGGQRVPRPALVVARLDTVYPLALAETPGLTVMWASAPADVVTRRLVAAASALGTVRPEAPPVPDSLAASYMPWRADTTAVPRRPPVQPSPTGDYPPATLADVATWLLAAYQAPQPGARTSPRRTIQPPDGHLVAGELLTAWQMVAFVAPQQPPATPRPAARNHGDLSHWQGADSDPAAHAGLWSQVSQVAPRPGPRQGQDCLQLDTTQEGGHRIFLDASQPPRRWPQAAAWWQSDFAPLPSPVANLLIIVGGPYSLSATGVYVAGSTIGEVLPQ